MSMVLFLILCCLYVVGIKSEKADSLNFTNSKSIALRGMFAVVIVMCHSVATFGSTGLWSIYKFIAFLAVAYFFAASGYRLMFQYQKKANIYRAFLKEG